MSRYLIRMRHLRERLMNRNRTRLLGVPYIIWVIGFTVIPIFFNGFFGANVSFGGTSLIIIVGVILETLKQIESRMLVRSYKGFLA